MIDRPEPNALKNALPGKMTAAQARQTTLGAARSELRSAGLEPADCTLGRVYEALDHIWRTDPATIAALFYEYASENQRDLFDRDWRKWQRSQGRRPRV